MGEAAIATADADAGAVQRNAIVLHVPIRPLTRGPDGSAMLARSQVSSQLLELRHATVAGTDPVRWQIIDQAANVYALLDHLGFRKLLQRALIADVPVLAFEGYYEQTLATRLAAGPVSEYPCLSLFKRMAFALSSAHRLGFVHGHLCPSRVLMDDASNPLLDFAWLDVGAVASELDFACTPPEHGREALDASSDIFSLGMLLRIALLGRVPTADDDAHAFGALATITAEMTRTEREARPTSAEVFDAIDTIAKASVQTMSTQALPIDLQHTMFSHPPVAHVDSISPGLHARRLLPGSMLGRFELLRKIGEGGMGEVYRAIDRATGHQAALKVLRPEASADAAQLRRFRKEARILSEIRSPYVASLIEINRDMNIDFIALEFVDGRDLAELLDTRGGRMSEREALEIVADVARGLAEAHARGIVHRDIKPQNVMIAHPSSEQPDVVTVKLCDFGIARALNHREGTLAFTEYGAVLGTPAYMAPEQCSGQLLSPATDVYALGVTLFLLLSGRLPFEASETTALLLAHTAEPAPGLLDVCSDVSLPSANLVARMLEKLPGDRFLDASALLEALEGVLRGDSAVSALVHPAQPAAPASRIARHVFEWDLKAAREQLWPLVCNTDRLNHALGVPPASFVRVVKALGVETSASNRIAGVSLRWREHPFEWIEGRRWSVLRVFSQGVMNWFTVELELEPKPEGGTRLRYTMTLEPRHLFGRWLVAFEMRFKLRPALGRAFARIDAYVTENKAPAPGTDPFEASKPLSETGRIELARGLAKLRESAVPSEMIDALGAFCEHASDQEIAQLRPLAFAHAHALVPDRVVDACLRAAHHGLFVLLWQVVCPLCRVPADFAESLRDLSEHGHCPSCAADFPLDFAQSLELVFRVSSAVRPSELRTYCVGGPAFAPHVVAQQRLAPFETLTLDLSLGVGAYRVRSPQLPHSTPLQVSNAARSQRGSVLFSGQAVTAEARVLLRPGAQQLSFENTFDHEIVVRVERSAAREDALTAARAACLASFRRLFPGEVLASGRLVAVGRTAFVIASLHEQRRMLNELGDARAFERILEHLRAVEECVAAEGGAVVKTASGSTLCAFESGSAAARAAMALRDRFDPALTDETDRAPLDVRIVVHQGAAVAATLDGRLDYFGHTVEAAHDLIAHAPALQVLLSSALAGDQNAITDVTNAGYALEVLDFNAQGEFAVLAIAKPSEY